MAVGVVGKGISDLSRQCLPQGVWVPGRHQIELSYYLEMLQCMWCHRFWMGLWITTFQNPGTRYFWKLWLSKLCKMWFIYYHLFSHWKRGVCFHTYSFQITHHKYGGNKVPTHIYRCLNSVSLINLICIINQKEVTSKYLWTLSSPVRFWTH